MKVVEQIQTWGDVRIKKMVQVLVAEGIKISSVRLCVCRVAKLNDRD